MMKYTYQRNLLTIDSKIIKFDGEIEKIIENNDSIILLLLMDKNLKTSQNVFCISTEGEIVWQVPFVMGHTSFGSPYTNISLKDGVLQAYASCGILYSLEPKTGKILKKEFVK